ncbi:MAG: hypothetical protein EPN36_14355 [Rhodanobacteraceae bacterium]|nr:MAG: hypothetical protein EPN36_14355 [Rhodanobacteraceae bacterium]
MLDAIATLEAHGFVPDGHTSEQLVRIPTSKSPVYGSSGGELATMGGRARYAKPGMKILATVGKRTTCVYHATGYPMVTMDTKDAAALKAALERFECHPVSSPKS